MDTDSELREGECGVSGSSVPESGCYGVALHSLKTELNTADEVPAKREPGSGARRATGLQRTSARIGGALAAVLNNAPESLLLEAE